MKAELKKSCSKCKYADWDADGCTCMIDKRLIGNAFAYVCVNFSSEKPLTYGDRIRQMTDEELAVLLVKYQVRGAVQAYGIVDMERAKSIEEDAINSVCGKKDIETALNMLKQDANEDAES